MANDNKTPEEEPRFKPLIEAADHLSLGISIVVAVLMGVGIGWLLQRWSGEKWTMFIGVFIGVAAAILNVYKAYSKQYKEYEELAKERSERMKPHFDKDDDDEDYGEKNY
ncbi:MAG: AtpZ/AtpI family protein [Campylobacterales bacterium]|nr:AtpZ/AtpI family protein [Campylobacterales bacterium]